MKHPYSVRRPGPLWATLTLLVAVSGLLVSAAGPGRQDAARRVRIAGSRGVRVTDPVRVEPYGRAAVEHVYLDDDDDVAVAGQLIHLVDASDAHDAAPAILPAAASFNYSAATALVAPPASAPAVRSAQLLGVPLGRAPPLT